MNIWVFYENRRSFLRNLTAQLYPLDLLDFIMLVFFYIRELTNYIQARALMLTIRGDGYCMRIINRFEKESIVGLT